MFSGVIEKRPVICNKLLHFCIIGVIKSNQKLLFLVSEQFLVSDSDSTRLSRIKNLKKMTNFILLKGLETSSLM